MNEVYIIIMVRFYESLFVIVCTEVVTALKRKSCLVSYIKRCNMWTRYWYFWKGFQNI